MVGDDDGTALGVVEGGNVGAVGAWLGISEGVSDGAPDGLADGPVDGIAEGAVDGARLTAQIPVVLHIRSVQ